MENCWGETGVGNYLNWVHAFVGVLLLCGWGWIIFDVLSEIVFPSDNKHWIFACHRSSDVRFKAEKKPIQWYQVILSQRERIGKTRAESDIWQCLQSRGSEFPISGTVYNLAGLNFQYLALFTILRVGISDIWHCLQSCGSEFPISGNVYNLWLFTFVIFPHSATCNNAITQYGQFSITPSDNLTTIIPASEVRRLSGFISNKPGYKANLSRAALAVMYIKQFFGLNIAKKLSDNRRTDGPTDRQSYM